MAEATLKQLSDTANLGYNRYQNLLGCSSINLTDTTNLYARYTTTFLCNAIVQNSVEPCGLSGAAARPVCADTCVGSTKQPYLLAAPIELLRVTPHPCMTG